jgi:hypothetical protein
VLALGATFVLVPDAYAKVQTPPPLVSVNHAVKMTHHWQALAGEKLKPYHWVAHRHDTPTWKRWHIAATWWGNAAAAHARYMEQQQAPASGAGSAWFVSAMACISIHEEYGMDGPNTVAGFFGYIYAPSQYQDPGPTIAATYGDSWLSVPLGAQLDMAWSLYSSFGWSPWSTAGVCGLA